MSNELLMWFFVMCHFFMILLKFYEPINTFEIKNGEYIPLNITVRNAFEVKYSRYNLALFKYNSEHPTISLHNTQQSLFTTLTSTTK